MENEWYFLDPDNRKDDPDVPHCCRCKRTVKATQATTTFISVEMHPEFYWVRKSITGKYLVGSDCWEKITKDGPANIS